MIFSVSAGLSEVLLSPTIAAIPSENPQQDMSLLHSLYAFGVFTMVVISTLFLKFFGRENWMILTLILGCLPILPAILFMFSPIPELDSSSDSPRQKTPKGRTVGLVLCALCIFFGSCAENTMSNWVSGYMEKALHIDKALGDILGVAMFAVLLGLARIGYAKFGKNINRVLLVSMTGAAVCYLISGLTSHVIVAFIASVLIGMFTAMLWPGSLILMEENIPGAGVAAYALMAAAGDFGASIAPQLMGIVTDMVAATPAAIASGVPEQIGMKTAMLISTGFPILGVIVLCIAIGYFKKKSLPLQSKT